MEATVPTVEMYRETLLQAERVLFRYGLGALISLGLTIWLAYSVSAEIRGLRQDLQHHITQDGFYLRAICLSLAKGDWAAAQACDPK